MTADRSKTSIPRLSGVIVLLKKEIKLRRCKVILIFLAHNKGCTKIGYVENEMMILLSKCYEQIK